MIISDRRKEVIVNIKRASGENEFHAKVEVNDPELTQEKSRKIVEKYLQDRTKAGFKFKTFVARQIANIGGEFLNRDTSIIGMENIAEISGGAIITCNHFSPLDNTVVRKLARRLGKKRINIVSQVTNFAMSGIVGFLMNYADTIPLSEDFRYISHELTDMLDGLLKKGELVLIYPEREMWFHYRKPRPGMRGAYYFAAKLNAPVISCFIEMQDKSVRDTSEFNKVRYTLHILPPLYPDPQKNVRENSMWLSKRDYEQKKQAYERLYKKKLSYDFEPSDIAGWVQK